MKRTYDVAIVLGHFPYRQVISSRQKKRLAVAIELFNRGQTTCIITTGTFHTLFRRTPINVAALCKTYLIEHGIPETSIISEAASVDTASDAIYSFLHIQKQCFRSALVITSADHFLRAKRIFIHQAPCDVSIDFVISDWFSGWWTCSDLVWNFGGWIKYWCNVVMRKVRAQRVLHRKRQRDMTRSQLAEKYPFIKHISVADVDFDIILNPVRNGRVDEAIALRHQWEEKLSLQLKKHLKPSAVFVDAGANIGYHSLFVASFLQGNGTVHAFEPIPHLGDQIQKSAYLNHLDTVHVHQCGLSNRTEERIFYIRDENIGGSSLQKYDIFLKNTVIDSVQRIPLRRLDEVLGNNACVQVMKIDVEGHEKEVLEGARNIIQKNHPVLFLEFSPVYYEQECVGKSIELITLLSQFGYATFDLQGDPLDLSAWLAEDMHEKRQIDVMCVSVLSSCISALFDVA